MNIIRAWKDEAYRQNLSTEEQAMLPASPVGEIELADTELETVYGAWSCKEKPTNEVEQDIDQKAIATFGDSIDSKESTVWCSVNANADFEAEMYKEFGKFCW